MSARTRGLLLALLHVLLVASLGAKLLYDRATRPRVWVRAAPVDPDLPFRGRYVQIRLEVDGTDLLPGEGRGDVTLSVEGERLVAHPSDEDTGVRIARQWRGRGTVLAEPVAFFIPEHATDPSRRRNEEELWVEVTVPRRGPPRPIRLGLKKGDLLTPLEF
jgi:uncharacterized membrane-anchored protein